MDLAPEQIRWIITYVLVLVTSVTFHEFGHAYVAHRLGDDTPSRQGRVTLNPLAHSDPIGTFLLPLISAYYAVSGGGYGGFGWGRPVQTNPVRYTRRFSMATAQVFVAIAGPSMNIALALLIALVHMVLYKQGVISPTSDLNYFLRMAVVMNFTLFFFNLVPVPPLDGGWVARRFIPTRHQETYNAIATYGPFIIMAVVMIPLLSKVFLVPARFCFVTLYGVLGVPLF